ncbi:MAG: FKBP-type peptidyl-prolyl cis-trans isomerase [Balneolales bacterium]
MNFYCYKSNLFLFTTLLLIGFVFQSCNDDDYYEPDLSTVPEARDTTGVEKVVHENGMVVYIHQEGEGSFTVSDRDQVLVRYTGRLTDGGIFDSSWIDDRTTPREFDLQTTIKGFLLGMEGMKEGGIRTLVIPPSIGYGAQPPRGSFGFVQIPPDATLIFEIELVAIRD